MMSAAVGTGGVATRAAESRPNSLKAASSGNGFDLPAAGEPVRFEQHIKALFRRRDRQSMTFAFDLWSHDDVSQYAEAILGRLRSGTMPCDGAWPDAQIEVFQRWIDAGMPA
jgi:hypothetical protein